ncbi:MAG: GGDEF domain-containing protein [Burkholderiaceae bacterium]|nr:GGDEF domain-containing protein [Burkholderiaceae bacterium]
MPLTAKLNDDVITRREFITAATVVVLIVAVMGLAFLHAETPLAEVKPFLPMFLTTIVLSDSLTAYLLWQRARIGADAFSGILASAYLYSAVLAAVQLPTFPGVFSATGLLGAGPQTAVWLWTFWHAGYPLLVLLALLAARRRAGPSAAESLRHNRSAACMVLVGPLLAAAVAFVSLREVSHLPQLIQDGAYSGLVQKLGVPVIGANIIGLTAYVAITRIRRRIDLWVAVALTAALADAVLTLHGGARYALGWYMARLLSVVSSAIVLAKLIRDIARLYELVVRDNAKLEQQALVDSLTRLPNRRAFEQRWEAELRRATRDRTPLSVLMIDIDRFKQINDSYGHARGDACLVEVAEVLARLLGKRPADIVARYGGEEFVALLPYTPSAEAQHIAERVREAVEARCIAAAPAVGGFVTVSIGCATYDGSATPPERWSRKFLHATAAAVLHLADQALYQAKRGGRNRVMQA